MDHSQSGGHSDSRDDEWDDRVERAATADVRDMLRTARRYRRERWVVGSIMLVAIALVAVLLFQIGFFNGSNTNNPPAAGSGAPTEPATLALDLSHPFAASPAATWPDGPTGILLPATPSTINGYSPDQVATAIKQVRDVLVASRLDRKLVIDHDPGTYLGALAPDARRQLEPLFGSGREAEAQSLVSLAAKGSQLLPAAPKVNGTMTVHAGTLPGELVVHTNYVFVYAFRPDAPDKISDLMDILVVVRADVDYILRTGDRWTPGSQGWWYGAASGYAYSIACDAYHRGFLAPAYTERPAGDVVPQDRGVFFNPESPLPPATGCAK